MIKTEYLNNGIFIKHYSDSNMMLIQNETGLMYSDPIDLVPCQYTYSETDISCDAEEQEEIEENLENENIE